MEDDHLKKLCECCLSVKDLIHISDEPTNLIFLCFSIQITKKLSAKKFPTYICNLCELKIKDCFKFRCQILDCQTKLNLIRSSSNFNIKSDDQYFHCDEFIKEELLSDLDDPTDSINLITENKCDDIQKKDKTNTKKDAHDNIKQEIKSNTKSNKKESLKKSKTIKKKISQHTTSLPFKLDKDAVACKLCGEIFTCHRLLVSHMAVHYPNFVCDVCGRPFVLKKYLDRHMKSHEVNNTSCTICKKIVKASSLRFHMKKHSDNNRFACPHCTERFTSFDHRVKHMEKVHSIDIYKYQCKICSKKFHLSHLLSKHIRYYHFRELNFTCNVCGKGFFGTSGLSRHMIKHTGEKNYHCDICSKSYSKKWSLVLHMRLHSGNVKKYKCLQCFKEFTQNGSLKIHIKNIHKNKI